VCCGRATTHDRVLLGMKKIKTGRLQRTLDLLHHILNLSELDSARMWNIFGGNTKKTLNIRFQPTILSKQRSRKFAEKVCSVSKSVKSTINGRQSQKTAHEECGVFDHAKAD
jgi:hypothetical protein